MKKLLSVILIAVLILPAIALAEVDLSGMSYADLLALRSQVDRELVTRKEWKEVTVPAGEWTVGEDIPEGSYSIKDVDGKYTNVFVWGRAKEDYESGGGLLVNSNVGYNGSSIGKVQLRKGNILVVSDPVILAPAQSLGF